MSSFFFLTFLSLFSVLTSLFLALNWRYGLRQPPLFREIPHYKGIVTTHHDYNEASRRSLTEKVRKILVANGGKMSHPQSASSLSSLIVNESLRAKYDPLFIAALVKEESGFNPKAVSNKGALGLMQIIPSTGRFTCEIHHYRWDGSKKLFEAQYNLRIGITYLKYLEGLFKGNFEQVLIAYNWGPNNLAQAILKGRRIPGSPQHYARSIMRRHLKWRREF